VGWKTKETSDAEAVNWDETDEVEGVLDGERTVSTKYGDKSIYTFRGVDGGEDFDVWGAAQLDRQLNDVEFGTRVKIKHLGLKRGKGGNRYHDFEVAVWLDDDAPAPAAGATRPRRSRAAKPDAAAKPDSDTPPPRSRLADQDEEDF
jgi:hypothetical protein